VLLAERAAFLRDEPAFAARVRDDVVNGSVSCHGIGNCKHGARLYRMDLAAWKQPITRAVEFVGVALILVGAAAATVRFVFRWLRVGLPDAYREYRQHLGRAILLGLEFLVAGDIINTVAVDPTFRSIGVLAGIVVIRTFLSFSLEVEIEGRWPWARTQTAGAERQA
jgi:uncharacterized membrane protein